MLDYDIVDLLPLAVARVFLHERYTFLPGLVQMSSGPNPFGGSPYLSKAIRVPDTHSLQALAHELSLCET